MKTTSRVFIVFLPSPPAGFDNYNPIYMKINNLQRKIPKEFSPPENDEVLFSWRRTLVSSSPRRMKRVSVDGKQRHSHLSSEPHTTTAKMSGSLRIFLVSHLGYSNDSKNLGIFFEYVWFLIFFHHFIIISRGNSEVMTRENMLFHISEASRT